MFGHVGQLMSIAARVGPQGKDAIVACIVASPLVEPRQEPHDRTEAQQSACEVADQVPKTIPSGQMSELVNQYLAPWQELP